MPNFDTSSHTEGRIFLNLSSYKREQNSYSWAHTYVFKFIFTIDYMVVVLLSIKIVLYESCMTIYISATLGVWAVGY